MWKCNWIHNGGVREPEKNMPSTAAKAISCSPNDECLSEIQRSAHSALRLTQGTVSIASKRHNAMTWRANEHDETIDIHHFLDHDTNVFYAYSNAELYSLNMGSLKASQEEPIPWADVQKPDLSVYDTNQATQTPGRILGEFKNFCHPLYVFLPLPLLSFLYSTSAWKIHSCNRPV